MKQFLYFISLIGLCIVCFVQNTALHEMKAVIAAQKNHNYVVAAMPDEPETAQDKYVLGEPIDSGYDIGERIETLIHHFEIESSERPSPAWVVSVLAAAKNKLGGGATE